jgi:hypothetical protein
VNSPKMMEATALIERPGLRLSQNYGLPRLVLHKYGFGLQAAP